MACNCNSNNKIKDCCDFNVNVIGLCDPARIPFSKAGDSNYKLDYNWSEISIPEILAVPCKKPDIEHIDQVLITVDITCTKLIETPLYLQVNTSTVPSYYDVDTDGFTIPLPNEEGTYLTGRKLVIEGMLKQKIVYTADLPVQSVHSAHFEVPFSTFIVVYPKFTNPNPGPVPPQGTVNVPTAIIDTSEQFCIDTCIEDVYVKTLDPRTIFKNVTLFLRARPIPTC